MARSSGSFGVHVLVVVLCALTAFPMLWMLSTAVKPPDEVFLPGIHLLPEAPTLTNFPEAFRVFPISAWFYNSIFIGAATTVGKLAISLPAAFAFARLRFQGRQLLFAMALGTIIVPGVVTIVPNYILIAKLDWINTKQGVIVP